MNSIMRKKAVDAITCLNDLQTKSGYKVDSNISFTLSDDTEKLLTKAVHENNPFPGVLSVVLLKLRKKAVKRLFEEEKVIQTAPASAILAYNAAIGNDIEALRNNTESKDVVCDVTLSGLQAIRLYMSGYKGNKQFIKRRTGSAINVKNALNGSEIKYLTKDGKYFSTHVYYESQKAKMMEVLNIKKDPSKFTFSSTFFDKKIVKKQIKQFDGYDLMEKSFANDACACVIQDRKTWEESEVGKAVCEMPLFKIEKINDSPKKNYSNTANEGPLAGVKVLDLTHIIAGPACTRLLAEQGADVLLVRRGKYVEQEQAMLEFDGWTGKNSIQLDFNIKEQLEKVKELIKEADVIVTSYQQGALDKFNLSKEDIRELNPNIIYATLMCFSDSVWKNRPGWAPLAEDFTGLSLRNGENNKPVNLNGVPLDYIPGFLLTAGVLNAIKLSIKEGGAYDVTASLTRGGQWLHECSDICKEDNKNIDSDRIMSGCSADLFKNAYIKIKDTSVGTCFFPTCATYVKDGYDPRKNMSFKDSQIGFRK